MKIETAPHNVRTLVITGAPSLDPITVFIENYQPGQGRITIRVYDRAWTAAWFAMHGNAGPQTVERFVAKCDWDYVHGNLTQGLYSRMLKHSYKTDRDYLRRIILAVQGAFLEGLQRESAT